MKISSLPSRADVWLKKIIAENFLNVKWHNISILTSRYIVVQHLQQKEHTNID